MNPPVFQPDEPSPKLRGFSLRQIAIVAFVVGVLLHACILTAVFSGGGGSSKNETPSISAPAVQPGTSPTPTPLPDRTNCAQIQGTNYRSEAERTWFLQNCTGGSAQPLPSDRIDA